MKKILTILSVGLILTFFSTCSMQEPQGSPQPEGVESSIYHELRLFNDSLLAVSSSVSRSGIMGKIRRGLMIASADFLGAGAGISATGAIAGAAGISTAGTGTVVVMAVAGSVCAAIASSEAYDMTSSHVISEPKEHEAVLRESEDFAEQFLILEKSTVESEFALSFPEEYLYLNSIGKMHNLVLEKEIPLQIEPGPKPVTMPTNGSEINEKPIDGDIYPPNQVFLAEEYIWAEEKVATSGELGTICVELVTAVNLSSEEGYVNPEKFIDIIGTFTQNEKEIYLLYFDALCGYPERMEEVIFIANNYIHIIQKSTDLSVAEKEKLYLGIAVSVNSIGFWAEKF